MDTTRVKLQTLTQQTSWHESSYWGTFWGQSIIEFVGGIIGSFIFLLLVLWLLKPKISIAPFLCNVVNNEGAFYVFKMVNLSFFAAHEIKLELHTIHKIPMGGKGLINNRYNQLDLTNSQISHVPGRLTFWR